MEEQIMAVQRMQQYIAEHLTEEITLTDLSGESLYSPWYSHRLFRQYTGLCPGDYIRRLRLSESARKLKTGETDVTGAAYAFGFDSLDGYRRAFLREFGCNPGEYSREPVPIPLFIPYGVKFRTMRKGKEEMKETEVVFVQPVVKPERCCVIKRGVKAAEYWSYCNEVGCDVWGILTSMTVPDSEPVCLWLPEKYVLPGTSVYVQGVEVPVDYKGKIPEGFDLIRLPAAEYLMFQGQPFREEDFEEAIGAVWDAVKKYDPSLTGYEWDSENPRIQLEPRGERGYIELVPVRKKG